MNLKNTLLNIIYEQIVTLRKEHERRTGFKLSPEETIGKYIDLTQMVFDETDYNEIIKRLEKE